MLTQSFSDRVIQRARMIRSWLVVGLDPDVSRFPASLVQDASDSASDLSQLIFSFNQAVIHGAAPNAVAFKPQAAFYEQYGLAGIKALQHTLNLLRSLKLPVILDGKRNDIGSTATAYARAWLAPERILHEGVRVRNDWRVDALTVSPFLGVDGIQPFVEQALAYGGGLFVLLRTSNPSGAQLQCLQVGESRRFLWEELAESLADSIERGCSPSSGLSSLGFVVGATLPTDEVAEIRRALPRSLFLMPGIGAQGGDIGNIISAKAIPYAAILPSASRSILYPDDGGGSWEIREGKDTAFWLGLVQRHAQQQAGVLAMQLQALLF